MIYKHSFSNSHFYFEGEKHPASFPGTLLFWRQDIVFPVCAWLPGVELDAGADGST